MIDVNKVQSFKWIMEVIKVFYIKKSTSIKCVFIWGEQVAYIDKNKTLIH
jgi:hypothetical protein